VAFVNHLITFSNCIILTEVNVHVASRNTHKINTQLISLDSELAVLLYKQNIVQTGMNR